MKSTLLTVASLSIFAVGCGHSLMQPKMAPPEAVEAAAVEQPVDVIASDGGGDTQADHHRPLQHPGDYVVHRFSGSYRDGPVTMTQRLVSRATGDLIIDVTIDDGKTEQKLRLRIDDTDVAGGELISVAKLDGNVQLPFGVARYEQLMDEITLTADENLNVIGSSGVTVDVGSTRIACTKTAYQVRVGEDEAVMETLSSDGFAWGDVGGQISTTDGKILYKAEILDIGDALRSSRIAAQGEPEIYDEFDDI
ncbi:MAG: hypothetical protein JRI68_16565 [Deltaproteobacteria bacterium]|nr:hypothetical protein [Deltaproteobacteria bacterium]